MKTISILYLIGAMLVFGACEEDVKEEEDRTIRIIGSGEVMSESEVVNPFTAINLEDVANVYVKTGLERKVVLTAYENILPYLDAHVVGNELLIRFNREISVSTDEEIRVDISVPDLREVSLEGVGNYYLSGPWQEVLAIDLHGVGNVFAFDLPLDRAEINIDGNGNVEIDAKESLDVDIDGLGNVFYKGSPELTIEVDGLGDVVQAE